MSNDRDYAIVIGIQHYKANAELAGPHQDTDKFMNWLLDPNGGNLPADPVNVGSSPNVLRLLSTEAYTPSQKDVDDWLGTKMLEIQRFGEGQTARRLYFYFSGHGIGVSHTNSALLLPEWTTMMRNYALSSEKYLHGLIDRGLFQEIYFFMDCCRNRIIGVEGSAPGFGAPAPTDDSISYLICYATAFQTKAYEKTPLSQEGLDNTLPRGLFTEVLVNGLFGAAAGKNGRLRVSDLVNYIERKLPELAKEHKVTQIPKFTTAISLEHELTARFNQLVPIEIQFTGPSEEVVLEDGDLIEKKRGHTANGPWNLQLHRGQYILRRSGETTGMNIFVDGLKNTFEYGSA